MNTYITYAVYRDGSIAAAGSLLDCWRWLLTHYGHMINDAFDLAESGIFITPVGGHYQTQKGNTDAEAAGADHRA